MNDDFFKVFIAGVIAFWIGMFWEHYTHEKREEKENTVPPTCIICQEQHKTHVAILEKLKKQIQEEDNHER